MTVVSEAVFLEQNVRMTFLESGLTFFLAEAALVSQVEMEKHGGKAARHLFREIRIVLPSK